MTEIEFVDRYSATGTPTPNKWTVCRGHCEGMGLYPMPMQEWERTPSRERPHICPQRDENDAWDFPPADGYLFVWCEKCNGSGRRIVGLPGYVLDVLHTYYYAIYWPLWASVGRGGRGFYGGRLGALRQLPCNFRWMWSEQKAQRSVLRSWKRRAA